MLHVNSKRSWLIFAGGVVAYLVAVTQRSSLSVAGVDAAERFHSSAAALSSLAALQLVVYAALQIPVGVLVDRLGPKALLAGGAVLMVSGQVIVALSPELAGAVVGRIPPSRFWRHIDPGPVRQHALSASDSGFAFRHPHQRRLDPNSVHRG